jgi:hypothetical protein
MPDAFSSGPTEAFFVEEISSEKKGHCYGESL